VPNNTSQASLFREVGNSVVFSVFRSEFHISPAVAVNTLFTDLPQMFIQK